MYIKYAEKVIMTKIDEVFEELVIKLHMFTAADIIKSALVTDFISYDKAKELIKEFYPNDQE